MRGEEEERNEGGEIIIERNSYVYATVLIPLKTVLDPKNPYSLNFIIYFLKYKNVLYIIISQFKSGLLLELMLIYLVNVSFLNSSTCKHRQKFD